MFPEMKEKFKGCFQREHVEQIEAMEEKLLRFERFTNDDALRLGVAVVEHAVPYGESISIRIIRSSDELTVFQYVGEGLSQRNINFSTWKYNTVVKTGHCSLWALAKEVAEGGMDVIFREDSDCLAAGGAFPIYVDGEMVSIITTSGLHFGHDHEVIIKALCSLKNEEMPEYTGILA